MGAFDASRTAAVAAAERRLVRRRYERNGERFAAPRPDRSLPEGTDRFPQIEHVVLLMMENHSFDNYFGTLGHGEGFALDADGAPAPIKLAGGEIARPFRDGTTRQIEHSPKPSWLASHIQFGDGTNDGFLDSVRQVLPGATPEQVRAPMRYWDEQDLPFYAGLARTFTLADRWFASCLGPTFPNRRFLVAGTACGLMDDLVHRVGGYPPAGTIFDLLTRNGIEWVDYHAVTRSRLVRSRVLGRHGTAAYRGLARTAHSAFPNLFEASTRGLQFTANLYPLGLSSVVRHLRSHEQFFRDVRNDALPPVSIVDPDFTSYSEENPQDVAAGEQFAARVIDAVMHGPGWRNTVLIWFYDEHGGYYDHVPPPAAVEPDDVVGQPSPAPLRPLMRRLLPRKFHASVDPNAAPHVGRRYDRLGFRIPAVVVSPWSRPGAVVSDVLDHTSVLRFLEDKWNLPSLTRRDAAANSPMTALDLDAPPAFATPPPLPAPARGW